MQPEQFQEAQEIVSGVKKCESALNDLRKVLYRVETSIGSHIIISVDGDMCDLSYALNKEDKQIVKDMLGYIKFSLENKIRELQDKFESL